MSALRILHLGKYYPPVKGGIETVVETLCQGERVWALPSALVLDQGLSTKVDNVAGVPVTRAGSVMTVGAVAVSPALPIRLARAEADVLVLHEPNPMALVAYFLARPSMPLVVWYHSEVVRPQWQYRTFYEPFLEFALRRAARIVVASPPMRDVRALAPYRHKCVVVPFGLPVERYAAPADLSSRVAPLRGSSPRPVFLFVGRLVAYKGLDVLLRALAELEADAVVIGDGPLRDPMQRLAGELGLGDRVRFLGEVASDQLITWYHACDALVLPSVTRQEAFGMVQLEAMLCGRPVISTDLGTGVAWVNQHERTGLVVKPNDIEALRGALARLIESPDLRRELGAAARIRVSSHFTAEGMCAATLALYNDVCNRPLKTRPEVAAVA